MAEETKFTLTIGDSIDMLLSLKATNLRVPNEDALKVFECIQQSYKGREFKFDVNKKETTFNIVK